MTDRKPVAVVLGASRGVGLALTKDLVAKGYEVLAGSRTLTEELRGTAAASYEGVDINDEGSLKPFQKAKIDLLIITAGSQTLDNFSTVTKDTIRQQMETNAIGPLFAVKALHEQLQKGCKVVLISSKNGSITEVEATGGELYGYRMSKVALNIAGKTLAGDLKQSHNGTVALIHPGVVNTIMLRSLRKARGVAEDKLSANTLSPEESASKIINLIDGLTAENSGSFWAADTGKIIGW